MALFRKMDSLQSSSIIIFPPEGLVMDQSGRLPTESVWLMGLTVTYQIPGGASN